MDDCKKRFGERDISELSVDDWVECFQKEPSFAMTYCPEHIYAQLTEKQSNLVNESIGRYMASLPRTVSRYKRKMEAADETNQSEPSTERDHSLREIKIRTEEWNGEIPYDPPYFDPEILHSNFLGFTFDLLTDIPERLSGKYSINSIRSLCGFDLENADDSDREELRVLQDQWQPGKWLLCFQPCDVFFVDKNDKNNIGKLNRKGISTVHDFIYCGDFPTSISEENAKKFRSFRKKCKEILEIESFMAQQLAYCKKLWQKKLEDFPVADVAEPDQNYCNFNCKSLNEFVLNDDITDLHQSRLQWEYRSIYPDWGKLNFTPDNFIENIGEKRKIKDIFLKKHLVTLEDFLNYNFGANDLKDSTKKMIKNIQKNIFPRTIEEPPVDIESKIAELKKASGIKDALKRILGNDYANAVYLDNYIAKIIEGKTLETIAKSTGKTKERIRQQVEVITKDLNDVAWWNTFCENFFTKFGRISTIRAVKAKGNELLGNHLGAVIAECLKKAYGSGAGKGLIDTELHTREKLEILNEKLSCELLSNGKARVSEDEFMLLCRGPLETYFDDLGLNKPEYISNGSLWDILKPAGRNADGGKTVILMRPGDFIRQTDILNSGPMLRDDIIKAMQKAGYTGSIPKNNFADKLGLAVYSQEGLQYKYMLQKDLPQLEENLLTEIVDSIRNKLKNAYCVNLELICEDFSNRLHNITPFMLKAILKEKNALEDLIYDNTSTQVWRNSEIIGLQQILEQKLLEEGRKVHSINFRLLAQRKGYHENALANAVNSSEKILTGGEKNALYYLHADLLDLDMKKFQPIFSMIENERVVSAEKLFESHKKLCEESGVKDARLLASILKKRSPYCVDYPVIAWNEESATTLLDMGIDFIKSAKWKSKEEIDAFYTEKHYNSQWFVLQKHPDIFLIAENCVAHRENIGWQDEYGGKLLDLANKALNESGKKYMKTGEFVYDLTMGAKKECLPVLKNTNWSPALIISLLDKSEEFAAAGCNNSVFFRKEEGLQNFEDLCCLIKKEENPPDIVRYLSEEGMISDSWKYDPANQEFIKKLLEN